MSQLHRSIAVAFVAAVMTLGAGAIASADSMGGYVEPKFANQVKPEYPDSARQASETGTVKVKVLVGADGKATSYTIFKSSGHKDLDDAVLAAVKQSTYKPAYSNGKPTVAYFDVTYTFTLQGLAEEQGNESSFESKLAANPNDAAARKSLAITLINKHDYAKAEDVLAKGTQLDPKNAQFWSLLGFAYYSDGVQNKKDDRYKQAVTAYDSALALEPKPEASEQRNAASAYGQYAFVLLEAQKAGETLPYAQKAAKLDPTQTQYQIELGEALQGTGDNNGAVAAFKNAQTLDDKKSTNVTARIYADMGVSQLNLGQESQGIASINQAEHIAPTSPVAYQALASYYIRKNNLDAALGPLNQLAQIVPNDAQVQVDIGDIYVQKRDYVKAKAAYDKALAIAPTNGNALFGSAQIAAAQDDLPGTQTALSKAASASPENAAIYNATIAAILLGTQGKGTDPTPDAIRYATAATTTDPNLANGWYDLGVGYARQGHKDQANSALHKAFDLFKAQNNTEGMAQVNARYKELNGADIAGYSAPRGEQINQPGH
ncbi:MAG: TonB family protein [Candidatus Eremiobacteraeota bacterium]|nr:TonB family protein [Candidatus Eremiobacteraeota bacterium]